jgi:hypothetical protein
VTSTTSAQAFIERRKLEEKSRSRLIFALDATASRQPTWTSATELQAEMFKAAGSGIDVQLVYYRGGECKASGWVHDSAQLTSLMHKISCIGGLTQIERVLAHALREADKHPIRAAVFVGDSCEEKPAGLAKLAATLGKKSVPVFMFREGDDPGTGEVFEEIARLSNGVCARFDVGSAAQLADLLRTVGRFATSGDSLALARAKDALRYAGSDCPNLAR